MGKSSSFVGEHVAKHVKDIYERLNTEALLSRCLKGLLQNANESLHACIWARCPKHVFVSKRRVTLAVALAIGKFNSSNRRTVNFLAAIGCQKEKRKGKRETVEG